MTNIVKETSECQGRERNLHVSLSLVKYLLRTHYYIAMLLSCQAFGEHIIRGIYYYRFHNNKWSQNILLWELSYLIPEGFLWIHIYLKIHVKHENRVCINFFLKCFLFYFHFCRTGEQ